MPQTSLTLVTSAQSGVERGAIDKAIQLDIPYIGAVTRNGWAEDAPSKPGVLANYPDLMELSTTHLPTKTDHNVQFADLIIAVHHTTHVQLREHAVILETAAHRNVPVFVTADLSTIVNTVRQLIQTHPVPNIMITGARHSIDPQGYEQGANIVSVIHNVASEHRMTAHGN